MSLEITHNPIATNQTDRYVTVNAVFFPRPPRVGEADAGNLICTMSSRRDLTTATRLRSKLYRQYVALGSKLQFGRTLEETTGIPISGTARRGRLAESHQSSRHPGEGRGAATHVAEHHELADWW